MRRAALAGGLLLALAAPAEARLPADIAGPVPDGGTATHISPALPAGATRVTAKVEPSDDDLFAEMRTSLAGLSPGKRLLSCIFIGGADINPLTGEINLDFTNDTLALLMVAACLEVARSLPPPATASAAAAGCGRAQAGVPVRITRSGGKFRIRSTGPPRRARSRFVVSCRKRGGALNLRIRSRKRGQAVRRVVGPKLNLGYANPAGGAGGGSVKTTFDAR